MATQHVNVDKAQEPPNTVCDVLFLNSHVPWIREMEKNMV